MNGTAIRTSLSTVTTFRGACPKSYLFLFHISQQPTTARRVSELLFLVVRLKCRAAPVTQCLFSISLLASMASPALSLGTPHSAAELPSFAVAGILPARINSGLYTESRKYVPVEEIPTNDDPDHDNEIPHSSTLLSLRRLIGYLVAHILNRFLQIFLPDP
jgi:hypothetical protein